MKKKTVVVVDDRKIFVERWKNELLKENINVLTFGHPFELFEFCIQNPKKIQNFECIIFDKITCNFDVVDSDFLKEFKRQFKQFNGISILSTSLFGSNFSIEKNHGFNGVVAKTPMKLSEIKLKYG